MKTIWKFQLLKEINMIPVYEGAKVIHVGEQNGVICIWMLLDPHPSLNMETRCFRLLGTGWSISDESTYLGTVQLKPWVWHIFEIKQ